MHIWPRQTLQGFEVMCSFPCIGLWCGCVVWLVWVVNLGLFECRQHKSKWSYLKQNLRDFGSSLHHKPSFCSDSMFLWWWIKDTDEDNCREKATSLDTPFQPTLWPPEGARDLGKAWKSYRKPLNLFFSLCHLFFFHTFASLCSLPSFSH